MKQKNPKINEELFRTIKICRSCTSVGLLNILSLGKQYLSDFVRTDKKPQKYPLTLVLCQTCSLLQLKHTVSPTLLYTERYGYRSGINKTMQMELKKIVEESLEKIKDQGLREYTVVDIGANDGTLLSNYSKNIFRIGIEPIKKFAKECSLHADLVINNFFNYQLYVQKLKNKKAHIITAISCFYDIDDPNQFLSDIKKILHKDGVFVIQQNYLVSMLEQNAFDNILHEHLGYYSLTSLENLLSKHGLEVFDVDISPVNGGSFRTYITFRKKREIADYVYVMRSREKRLKLEEKKIYKDFAKRVCDNRDKLYRYIKHLVDKKKKVYVYGASTRGNTTLQYCKLDKTLITAAIERNPEKWGKKIASVGIPIISEQQARIEKPDYMLVLPWFFKKEFLNREQNYLKSGGHFIFPLPNLEIVDNIKYK